ncbi:MAG: hypothetical protein GYB53_10175 [Rhodobacteraceae bacterium]|nr:hypothetical protein [Paracoccaceae bacterium]MBR9820757.1 hypothetical protein [Paracoccaceae bacterium]
MASIHVESVLSELDSDLKRALEATIKKEFPEAEFNRNALYRAFVKQARKKCSTWEQVSDGSVRK